jgi:hypothetical protein
MKQPDDTRREEPVIPPYEYPLRSQLEPFTVLIRELREERYPYHVIVEWLRERGVAISWQGVQKFCRRRGIVKGKRHATAPPVEDLRRKRIADRVAYRKAEKETEKIFRYDGYDKPIRTWRDDT